MAKVELKNVTKRFGTFEAVRNLNLTIEDGSFCTLLGPSGCGKSTLLRMIAGLEDVDEGSVLIDGEDVTNIHPADRGTAMVFQSYALYPHLTVAQNIGFPLSVAGQTKDAIARQVNQIADLLKLTDFLHRKPAQLSGGQRQRVAIGRALVRDPRVFLFDEPLSNLDAMLRVQMRVELARLHQEVRKTKIYVTHDQVEAMTLSDKIVVMNKGETAQVGTPVELYDAPADRFVASFIGSPAMNFFDCSVQRQNGSGLLVKLRNSLEIELKNSSYNKATPESPGQLGLRPEHVSICSSNSPRRVAAGNVVLIERLGSQSFAYVDSDIGSVVVLMKTEDTLHTGQGVNIEFSQSHTHLF